MTNFYDGVSWGTDDGIRDAMKALKYDGIPIRGVWENGERRFPLSPVWDGFVSRNANSSFVYSWDFNENADVGETILNPNQMFRGWDFDDDGGQANYIVNMGKFNVGPQFGSMKLAGNSFGRPPMWRWKPGLNPTGIYNFYLSYQYREDNRATNGTTAYSLNPYIMLHDLSASNTDLTFDPGEANEGCFIMRHYGYTGQNIRIAHKIAGQPTSTISSNQITPVDFQDMTMRLTLNFNSNTVQFLVTNERNDWDQTLGTVLINGAVSYPPLAFFENTFLVNFGVSCSAANVSDQIPGTMYGFRIAWNAS